MLKASELQIVENWDTFGLRGSGSNQVIADNVYVPMERILRLSAADSTGRPPEADYDQGLSFIPCSILSSLLSWFSKHGIRWGRKINRRV